MDTATDKPLDELPDTLTIPLRDPITLGGEEYKILELREPTAAEMLQWDKLLGLDADVRAVSIVSGWPEPVIKQLKAREFIRAYRFVASFLS